MKCSFFLLYVFLLPLTLLSQTVTFSSTRGFYSTPFQLTLTGDANYSIRYTTDGTAPTNSTGIVYSGPINIDNTSVIRAIGFNGATVTPVITHTYLFLDSVIRQPANIPGWPNNTYNLGEGAATARHDYEMDPAVVDNPAYKNEIINALKDIPTLSVVMDKNNFWTMYDGDAEFPTSVELIYPNNPLANEQFNCGIESHSHLRLKRSIRLVLNNKYFPSGLKSNILRNAPVNGPNATNTFTKAKIVLRAGNNRSWARNWNQDRTCYTRDQWYRDAQIDVSGIGSHGTFVHLYINGLYWGLYNPSERLDADWEAAYMGGIGTDWMQFSQDGIRSGDATRFNYLKGPLIAKDMNNPTNYSELKSYLDVANFSDYLILSWMNGMQDWPENNYAGGNRNNPVGTNMFFAWDAEWSWDDSKGSNNGAWVHPAFRNNQTGSGLLTNLWHSLRRNSDFTTLFADRVYRNCFNNGQLSDSMSRLRWRTLNNYINKAIIAESARWGDAVGDGITRTKNDYWQPEIDRLDNLMSNNVQRFITALRAQGYYPSIEAPAFSKEGGIRTTNAQLSITNPNSSGVIYYTVNGDDPRLPGGALSSSAIPYAGVIDLTNDITIKARIFDGSTWSAVHEGTYFTPKLKINEFMASNTSTVKDEFGVFEDWIEIYNASAQPVDIGGMYITDALSNPTQWKIPTTNPDLTTIPPNGFLLLWADRETAQGPLHVDIKLSGSGEQIGLAMMDGVNPIYIDSLSFGPQVENISRGLFPDGSSTFRSFNVSTPGKPNILIQQPKGLFINEFLASNISGTSNESGEYHSWIEIHNKNNEPVNIAGLYLTNNLSNPTLYQIPTNRPDSTTIPANGFILLWADGQTTQGALHLNFTLSTSGQIGLVEKIGSDVTYIDSFTYNVQTVDISSGRYPDGSINFKFFNVPTPKSANILPAISGLFINEFLASNSTGIKDENNELDDWVEIYNSTSEPIDIGGLFITDNLANPGKWQIPTSRPDLTTIPAKGFKLLWADEQTSQGVLHTNIKLSAGGEQLGLVQINGNTLTYIDSLSFEIQKTDTSRGRYPNGGSRFTTFGRPTPGSTNDTIPNTPGIVLTLVNSISDLDIQTLKNGDELNLSTLGSKSLNVRASSTLNTTKSIVFNLSGKQTKNQTESTIPYSLFGDVNGNYNNWTPAIGTYNLKATAYTGTGGSGTAEASANITFTVISGTTPNIIPTANAGADKSVLLPNNGVVLNGSGTDNDGTVASYTWKQIKGPNTANFSPNTTTQEVTVNGLVQGDYLFTLVVTDNVGASSLPDSVLVSVTANPSDNIVSSFTLINSTTDTEIKTLVDGDVINVGSNKFNVRANTNSNTKSVIFELSGAQVRKQIESGVPFSLFGDNNGNYNDWTPVIGKTYTLKCTPYSATGGGGTSGTSLTINFSFVNQIQAAVTRRMKSVTEGKLKDKIQVKRVTAYPNPNSSAIYTIFLPVEAQGEVSFSLVSSLGNKLVEGKQLLKSPTTILNFDFSKEMIASGIYHLRINGKELIGDCKLVKVK